MNDIKRVPETIEPTEVLKMVKEVVKQYMDQRGELCRELRDTPERAAVLMHQIDLVDKHVGRILDVACNAPAQLRFEYREETDPFFATKAEKNFRAGVFDKNGDSL